MLKGYLEVPDRKTLAIFDKVNFSELRKGLFGGIVDQGYPGSKMEDISLVPRILPRSYVNIIENVCLKLTKALLKISELEQDILIKHLVPDSRWEKLVDLGVLDRAPDRMVGELRYDFALCGPLTQENPPRVMEVNAGALGGIVYASLIPKLLKRIVPDLDHLTFPNLAKDSIEFYKRLGGRIANFVLGEYSWGEDVLATAAEDIIDFLLVTPVEVPCKGIWPKLINADYHFSDDRRLQVQHNGRWCSMDGFRWSRVLEHKDIDRFGRFLKEVQDSDTIFISPLRMDFVCHKGVLPLLCNTSFLRNIGCEEADDIARFVPRSWNVSEIGLPSYQERKKFVLKQNFGCSGNKVFVGRAMDEMERKIDNPQEWILQERLELNQMYARFLYSQDQAMRMDLGVFVQYEYEKGRLIYHKMCGLITRGAQRYRVNLNLGGACIPVFVNESE